jgi:hypothetical protein
MSKRGPKPKATGGAALVDRIFDRVVVDPATGCANWQGAKDCNGYAVMWLHGLGCMKVSRVVLMLRGYSLTRRRFALHACDNPLCVSPAHLSVGSAADNAADRDRKGRHPHVVAHRARMAEIEDFFDDPQAGPAS